ncbi:MAG: PEP-CTERM sorting domain-containing protein [Phycisphaerales bacterium JB063]
MKSYAPATALLLLPTLAAPALAEDVALDFGFLAASPSQNTMDLTVGVEVRNVPVFGTLTDSDSDASTISGNALALADLDFLPNGDFAGFNDLAFTGGRLQFDEDLQFNLSLLFGAGTVTATGTDLAGSINTPGVASPLNTAGGFDLAFHQVLINEGTLVAVGSGAAADVNESFDFGLTPLPSPLAGTADLDIVLDSIVGNTATYTATLTAPVTFSQTIDVDADTTVSLTATGNLVATDTFTRELTLTQPGDIDGDGFVGAADLDVLLANWDSVVLPGQDGDLSGNGLVDQADLDIVQANFGNGTPPGVVPEPTSLLVLGLGGLALVTRRRR